MYMLTIATQLKQFTPNCSLSIVIINKSTPPDFSPPSASIKIPLHLPGMNQHFQVACHSAHAHKFVGEELAGHKTQEIIYTFMALNCFQSSTTQNNDGSNSFSETSLAVVCPTVFKHYLFAAAWQISQPLDLSSKMIAIGIGFSADLRGHLLSLRE